MVTACSSQSDNQTEKQSNQPSQSSAQRTSQLSDVFSRRILQITTVANARKEPCAWMAVTEAQRNRGLSLLEADEFGVDGAEELMVFSWDSSQSVGFWMKDTKFPISLAWVDDRGQVLSVIDMPVCAETCPSYPSPQPVRYAIEAPQGDLGKWGIQPGAKIALGTSC